MARPADLPEQQRRALDRVKPVADELGLYLADGSAVAIHLHHRTSRDLDLFSRNPQLALERVRRELVTLPNVEVASITDVTLRMQLDGVPVDIVQYPYPLLEATADGPGQFPIASLQDLATMKLSAAARRGIRRDFWDLYEIFQSGALDLQDALRSYVLRFGVTESDLYHVLRALTFFDDADADPLFPDGLTTQKWQAVKAWFSTHAAAALRESVARG